MRKQNVKAIAGRSLLSLCIMVASWHDMHAYQIQMEFFKNTNATQTEMQ